MSDCTAIHPLLACPRCDRTPLGLSPNGYHCNACRIDFPNVNGIPFLFAEPNGALGEWRERFHLALKTLQRDRDRLRLALNGGDLDPLTAQRLQHLADAYASNSDELTALMQPLELAKLSGTLQTYLALRTRLPIDQGLNTYYPNIHRDWCWGDAENRASIELLLATLGGDLGLGKTLVLGAGAGRLAYDLHLETDPMVTLAMDFNPLLVLVAEQLFAGKSLKLHEFPIAPARMRDQAVERTLAAPQPVGDGFHLILGDALRPPFPARTFDTVVTPWLIDILPVDFKVIAARVNALLTDGGRWLNFGSLAFRHPEPALCYSYEETMELVATAGFATPEVVEATLPYMCSPASRHGRRETVVAFTAAKQSHRGQQPRYQALPDWIVTGKEPVPLNESFQTQAMSTRIYSFVMSMIDGKRTLKDMAKLMQQQKLMASDEAESAIRSFLIKMYDESRRYSGL